MSYGKWIEVRSPVPESTFCLFAVLPGELSAWRVIHSTQLAHASVGQASFDELVTKERKYSPSNKQGSGVAIPINTRSATTVVDCLLRPGLKFSELAKLRRVVMQEQDRHRVFDQVTVTRPAWDANG